MKTDFSDKPSKSYQECLFFLQELIAKEGEDSAERVFADAIHQSRRNSFSKGLSRSKGPVCVYKLQGKACPRESCLGATLVPVNDHISSWNHNGKTSLILAQPYSLDLQELKKIIKFCELNNLNATIDAKSSWHFPARTLAVRYEDV